MQSRRTRLSLALVGALACALGAGCGSRDSSAPALYSSLGPRSATVDPLPFAWPPKRGEAYPNLRLSDHRGEPVELSSFRGKVLLIEPIGMT